MNALRIGLVLASRHLDYTTKISNWSVASGKQIVDASKTLARLHQGQLVLCIAKEIPGKLDTAITRVKQK